MPKYIFPKGSDNPKWKGGKTFQDKKCADSKCTKSIEYRATFCGKHRVRTDEWRRKQSESHQGKTLSLETRQKMSIARKGRKLSPETCLKMSLARKNKPNYKQRGSNNPSWKGGITPLNTVIRHCFKYRQWRCDVFERDNFTCQICYNRGNQNINADHYPKMFSQIMQEYNIKSLEQALDCEELWNINNGRTLCVPCHKEVTFKK